MTPQDLQTLLDAVRAGTTAPDEAAARVLDAMRTAPFDDLGFARVDTHRHLRQGFPEVILGSGKTPAQIAAIAERISSRGHSLLVTRASAEDYSAVRALIADATYHAEARTITASRGEIAKGVGTVLVMCAGTSDLPVAEEAAITAEVMGNTVDRLYDVGVAGIHRVLGEHARLRAARVLIVVAGMEGALPSVVAGLVQAPVIAVPTSVGYGSSLEGVTALLAMHASCAAGITVVGIDNGYGAACAVARMLS